MENTEIKVLQVIIKNLKEASVLTKEQSEFGLDSDEMAGWAIKMQHSIDYTVSMLTGLIEIDNIPFTKL